MRPCGWSVGAPPFFRSSVYDASFPRSVARRTLLGPGRLVNPHTVWRFLAGGVIIPHGRRPGQPHSDTGARRPTVCRPRRPAHRSLRRPCCRSAGRRADAPNAGGRPRARGLWRRRPSPPPFGSRSRSRPSRALRRPCPVPSPPTSRSCPATRGRRRRASRRPTPARRPGCSGPSSTSRGRAPRSSRARASSSACARGASAGSRSWSRRRGPARPRCSRAGSRSPPTPGGPWRGCRSTRARTSRHCSGRTSSPRSGAPTPPPARARPRCCARPRRPRSSPRSPR
jgi:hypothetical protein